MLEVVAVICCLPTTHRRYASYRVSNWTWRYSMNNHPTNSSQRLSQELQQHRAWFSAHLPRLRASMGLCPSSGIVNRAMTILGSVGRMCPSTTPGENPSYWPQPEPNWNEIIFRTNEKPVSRGGLSWAKELFFNCVIGQPTRLQIFALGRCQIFNGSLHWTWD